MDFSGFRSEELTPFIGLTILVLGILAYNYSKGYKEVWSPLGIISIILLYYCVIGPYYAILTNKTYDRLLNMRPFYVDALWGAFVFFLSAVLGFYTYRRTGRHVPLRVPDAELWKYGRWICIIGFVLFTVSTGGNVARLINPLDAEAVTETGGAISNYLTLSLNFLIPGIAILFVYYLRTKRGFLWVTITFLVTTGIFVTLGFRYRIVLLLGAMAITYYLYSHRRPNLIISFAFFGLFIVAMGIISITRIYGRGIDTTRLEETKNQSYFESGLNESRIFQTSGAVIALVPDKIPYVGFQPIISTVLFPIPKAIYKEKNSAQYLLSTLDAIYGKITSIGSAFMSYAEYYLAFGWLGIVIGGGLIGHFFKRLWTWYLCDPQNPLYITTYAVTVSFLYVIISRGYLPQVTMLFFFSAFPMFVIQWIIRRNQQQVAIRKRTPNAI